MLARIALLAMIAGSAVPSQNVASEVIPGRQVDAVAAALAALNASEGEQRLGHARALAAALARAGRNEAAAARLRSEIERAERAGVGGLSLSVARTELAAMLLGLGRLGEAREAAATAESLLGGERPGSVEHVAALLILGRAQNAAGEAKAAGLTLGRAADGAANMPVLRAQVAEAQGHLALLRGDGVGAIRLYDKAIKGLSDRLGPEHARLAAPLTGLANAHQLAGDYNRSRISFARAIRIAERSYGERSNQTSAIHVEYARLLTATGDHQAARDRAERAYRAIDGGTPAGRARKGLAASARGFAELGLGRPAEARRLFKEGIAVTLAERGANSPDLPPGYIELARLDLAARDPRSAECYARLAEAILARQAPDAPLMAEALSLRAAALSAQGRHGPAVRAARDAAAILTRRNGTLAGAATASSAALTEQVVRRSVYERLLDVGFAAGGARRMEDSDVFSAAQALHLGAASASVNQLAVRHAAAGGPLAAALVERRGLLEELRAVEQRLEEARTDGSADAAGVAAMEARRAELAERADRLDARLAERFPNFAALMRPSAADPAAIRAKLRPGEAFLLQATTAHATHLWLVTRDRQSPLYARTPFGSERLGDLARAVRAGVTFTSDGSAPRYDARAAHQLYLALLEPFAATLKGVDTLIASTDRQVHALPLAMLVGTDPGGERDIRRLDFLLRHRAATAWSPSPASFVALRSMKAAPPDLRPFFGAGAPVLLGSPDEQDEVNARIIDRIRAGVEPDDLRRLQPIPDTERQLKELGAQLRAEATDVRTGGEATEAAVKAWPLQRYRTIAFATHGLVAGRFTHLAEPGLVLTPPPVANGDDDGLLTASEISTLSLDADLVILSACETASPDGSFAGEGLSGLARAFYFAGARSLLVSGWSVKSAAVERLTTEFVRIRAESPGVGKAEALRRSMRALADRGGDHPAYWASFMLAGEPG